MLVQIYTSQTPAEARALATLGVDHIGLTPAQRGLPGEIDDATARQIRDAVAGKAIIVALSVEADLDEIARMANIVQPDILHLCGDIKVVTPAAVGELRDRFSRQIPEMKIMQAIPVVNAGAVDIAMAYQSVADYLILDSVSPDIDGIGAAGVTHDWHISREIVTRSRLPVILAGGLSAENVAEAIRAVRPWGVDSLTKTNRPLGDGRFCKDLDRVRAFVTAARADT